MRVGAQKLFKINDLMYIFDVPWNIKYTSIITYYIVIVVIEGIRILYNMSIGICYLHALLFLSLYT